MLDRRVLKGAVVTIDAVGCQTATVQDLRTADADNVLAVEHNGGRHERCTCMVQGSPDSCEWVVDPEAWSGMHSLIRVRTEHHRPRARECAVCCYISSRLVDAEAIPALVCDHWGVANGLHRTFDVQFRKDDDRLCGEHVPIVMGILHRTVLNIVHMVQQNFRSELSIGLQWYKIGRRPALLAPILA